MDRLVGVLAAQHAVQVEGGEGAPAFLLADKDGFAEGGVLRRAPGEGKRLDDGEPLDGIDGKPAGAHDIADDIDEAGAADLDSVAGAELWIMVGGGVGSAGVEDDRVRGFGVVDVKDVDQAAGVG